MSEYRRGYCPIHGETCLEDDLCMNCLEEAAELEHAERMQKVREDELE